MKGWDDWTHTEKAIFIAHLNQPDAKLDAAIAKRDREWALNDKEGMDERAAIQAETPKAPHKWSRIEP